MKDVLGFVLMLLGIGGILGGIGAVSRDMPIGWLALVIGGALSALAYRTMAGKKAPASATTKEAAVD